MQSLKKFYFGKQKAKVNTYIGGIGGTINTPALLAARLGISESRIKLFKVTGVDIECAIIGDYSLTAGLREGGLLTYFIDKDGLAKTFGMIQVFVGQNNMHTVYAPKTTYVRGAMCYNSATSLKRVYMPLCTTFGEYNSSNIFVGQASHSSMFLNSTNRLVLYLHPSLQTVNSGNPDPDILDVTSRGGQVRYVTNFTPPNAVTNLSTGTIYNTAVQLNFTPPTSVNGIDFYEVYVNGEAINSKEIKNSGEFITGLTPSTNYNIRIVAVDMFYNKSELSNTVNVTTTNTVLDVDANAYMLASYNGRWQPVINSLFTDLKSQGLYNKIQAFYPFLGTTAAQHKWNAKNPLDTNAAFRLQFFGGGTHSNLGYQCNGTNAYANTFFVPSANTSVANSGITLVSGTNNPAPNNNTLDFGAEQTTPFPGFELSLRRRNGAVASDDLVCFIGTYTNASQNGGVRITDSDIRGATTFVSTSLSNRKLFQNGQLLITDTKITTNQLPTIPAYIGCLNNQGSPFGYSNQRIQFTAIHQGLTDVEVVALHTIIDNFETAIGRKTW